jgi:hypothetical protein
VGTQSLIYGYVPETYDVDSHIQHQNGEPIHIAAVTRTGSTDPPFDAGTSFLRAGPSQTTEKP